MPPSGGPPQRQWTLEGTGPLGGSELAGAMMCAKENKLAILVGFALGPGERVVVAPVLDVEARCREVAKELRFDAGPKEGFAVLPRSTLHALADKLDGVP